ncbi:hypothetical protein E1B28_010662 [Marasmius oreades]|uniref:Uncharacterized protein n=1 Tax=Marasmius oreades TaxID=181124 RepID=A0A9P7RYS3_9AGAR|nr:uncharacterized protein E1B28_010662 [Marasmius oreades]KAG7091641.1 hypothetical protein E1B28_010662 [Marasmius oreades]
MIMKGWKGGPGELPPRLQDPLVEQQLDIQITESLVDMELGKLEEALFYHYLTQQPPLQPQPQRPQLPPQPQPQLLQPPPQAQAQVQQQHPAELELEYNDDEAVNRYQQLRLLLQGSHNYSRESVDDETKEVAVLFRDLRVLQDCDIEPLQEFLAHDASDAI